MKHVRPDTTDRPVLRRRLFYVPGYDPFPPRRYRELYRREGAAQAALSGYRLAVTARRSGGASGWRVAAEIDGVAVATEVEVLVWSDLVRASMQGGILRTYAGLLRTAWTYLASGALFRLMRLRRGPVIAALYPVGMLLAQLAVALAAAALAGRLAAAALPGAVGWTLGTAAGAAVALAVLRLFRRFDGRLFAHYLMQDFAYSASARGAYPPALEARLAAFAAAIRAALGSDADEVLVVGHSSGAHLAVSVLADLVRGGLPAVRPALSLLTLGQVIPMVSFLPDARRLRGDLRLLSQEDAVTWVDVTAPGDGCAFALCDPVAVTGVAPPARRWPLVLSAAFTRTLRPETWRRLRWRFFRLHFQYLCAFDALSGAPGDYDYFRITAGPRTLARHVAGRRASRSRRETPASRFTSVA
jgi:hypothetical protein